MKSMLETKEDGLGGWKSDQSVYVLTCLAIPVTSIYDQQYMGDRTLNAHPFKHPADFNKVSCHAVGGTMYRLMTGGADYSLNRLAGDASTHPTPP